jgi:DNA-binding response OmpR family regulator
MSVPAKQSSSKRRLLLASDRSDRSSELASILQTAGEVDTISTSDIPDDPAGDFAGIVVDINLRSSESVQMVRNKLRADAYRAVPRLFVLADALHHGTMQAWALGATDTISRPFDAQGILQRVRSAFPDSNGFDATPGGEALNTGVAAAHAVMVKIFEKLPAGVPLTFDDVVEAENKILKAIKHSSLRQWLTTSAAIIPSATGIACLSPALPWHSRSISGCVRTTSAVWPVLPCCMMSARRSSPWRSWTSLQNSPTRK